MRLFILLFSSSLVVFLIICLIHSVVEYKKYLKQEDQDIINHCLLRLFQKGKYDRALEFAEENKQYFDKRFGEIFLTYFKYTDAYKLSEELYQKLENNIDSYSGILRNMFNEIKTWRELCKDTENAEKLVEEYLKDDISE